MERKANYSELEINVQALGFATEGLENDPRNSCPFGINWEDERIIVTLRSSLLFVKRKICKYFSPIVIWGKWHDK